ncbi:hypothetical protein GYMLUDRAFT_245896 [Collybiopsis luxurians FD-317 M1]|uniref:F-box domain-containing protein n=1 Tax=Collybiopsis luxurians FD-317 M1 TaxID=944289 RepID=A0A0D0CK58_9AGAR|nr:hypothetical protein GYMLUDRAFT_245896 [Collybiopsis luxurians FD-317 M1]
MESLATSNTPDDCNGQEWSYPVRRSGNRILSEIPLDVYTEIFSYFKPPKLSANASRSDPITQSRIRNLCSLFLVCHLFHLEIRPLIFNAITFRPDVDAQSIPRARESKAYDSLYRTLEPIRIPQGFIPHVRRCVFIDRCDFVVANGTRYENTRAFLHKRNEALLQMTNLSSLTLFDILIASQILAVLQDTPNLRTLSIEQCTD